MAITYFNSATSVADNGSAAGPTATIVPPSSMQAGDLVIVYTQYKSNLLMLENNQGGQAWAAVNQMTDPAQSQTSYWCRFNGTWAANPTFTVNGGSGTAALTAVMHVFRPTNSRNLWVRDNGAQSNTIVLAPSTPFDCTITAITTARNNELVIASWTSTDDNTWSIQTAGWSAAGTAQYRNLQGQDQSMAFAYKVQSLAGTTGNVTNRQTANGGDDYFTTINCFYEIDPNDYQISVPNTDQSSLSGWTGTPNTYPNTYQNIDEGAESNYSDFSSWQSGGATTVRWNSSSLNSPASEDHYFFVEYDAITGTSISLAIENSSDNSVVQSNAVSATTTKRRLLITKLSSAQIATIISYSALQFRVSLSGTVTSCNIYNMKLLVPQSITSIPNKIYSINQSVNRASTF